MSNLTGKAGGEKDPAYAKIEQAHLSWEQAMVRRIDEMRTSLRGRNLAQLASLVGGEFETTRVRVKYWLDTAEILWPGIEAISSSTGKPLSTFDLAMLIYYLETADGTALADHWIGFRELPDGAFYHQAFEGYSGRVGARHFGGKPERLTLAAEKLQGVRLPDLAPHAFSFLPLPRIRLAIALWPGDEDFPARASVLFDAAAPHYMTTDGLALLGAGLVRRLIRADSDG